MSVCGRRLLSAAKAAVRGGGSCPGLPPLLSARSARRQGSRGGCRSTVRVALAGIVYVLLTGISWNQPPAGLVGCSGVTCWRRVRDWTEAVVWLALHDLLLAELRAAGLLELNRMAVDASHVYALEGETTPARRRSTAAIPAPSAT